KLSDINAIVFYDKPLIKFERLLETYLAYAPKGFSSFAKAMPIWLKEKLYLKLLLKKQLAELGNIRVSQLPTLLFSEHHLSHAASCFYPSPFNQAAVLCLDGVGEWATTSAWIGEDSQLSLQWEINFPHSLGLLYSAFTYYSGFKVNSGEYKLMGLAPYGEPKYVDTILNNLLDIKDDGTFRLDMSYFDYCIGLTMTNDKFSSLFGEAARTPESTLSQKHMDIASSIQYVTELIVTRLAKTLHKETGKKNLCLAGGVALNCVANGKLVRENLFENIWIQPAAGDAGGALGAALVAWHENSTLEKQDFIKSNDEMNGSYLGPVFTESQARKQLDKYNAVYESYELSMLTGKVAELLVNQNVIGWFQGRMEFGPRALGNRSIIADPRSAEMQTKLNLKIKFRESFRPFAPAVLDSEADKIFDLDCSSPYMMIVANLLNEHCTPTTNQEENLFGIDKLKIKRSNFPAITHVDYSARIQTVHQSTNPEFHSLLKAFFKKTNCPMLVNTSFNVRGEPIVCSPEDAYRCFMRTNMDYLVINNLLLKKSS
ncbi:UNVERIFIED_CONTAM: hypothetical protein GTU68_039614, partial [Idotea baltica]|nr:hypothetical protein [Idotea baltica]